MMIGPLLPEQKSGGEIRDKVNELIPVLETLEKRIALLEAVINDALEREGLGIEDNTPDSPSVVDVRANARESLEGWSPPIPGGTLWTAPVGYKNADGVSIVGVVAAKDVPKEILERYSPSPAWSNAVTTEGEPTN